MGKINISNIYAYIHKVLRTDPEIQRMIGITPNSTLEEMATKIQKRKKPQELVKPNLPIISFYKNPGMRGENFLEYRFIVDFDIYTQDDVELAINIADRISQLFDDEYIAIAEGSFFKGLYMTSAEDDTDLKNTFKYFTQIAFTIGIED